MGYIEGPSRDQIILFPESIDEYIAEDNCVRVIDEYVEHLDMEKLGFRRATEPLLGRPSYDPRDLLKLYIYGYLNRIRSSRRLEHEAIRNIEVMWLLKKLRPDFKTIADFRKDNKKALKEVFRDFNKLCDELGLFGKEMVAIDGSKFRASNSKKNNYNAKKLNARLQAIDKKIETYMKELEKGDAMEEGVPQLSAKDIQAKIQELRQRKAKHEGLKQKLEQSDATEISTTDPDARLMANNNNTVDVSYNVQTTVDAKHKLIVDFKVSQQPNDQGELDNMALRVKKIFGGKDFIVLADKGYYKAEDLKKCVRNGITPYVAKQTYSNGTGDKDFYADKFHYDKEKDVYICPAKQELSLSRVRKVKKKIWGQEKEKIIGWDYQNSEACAGCAFKARCTKSKKGRIIFRHVDQDFLDTIDRKTQEAKDIYKLRQQIVEHPFGTVKRGWDAFYFLTRKKVSVTAEISLSFLAYNLRRVISVLGVQGFIQRMRALREPAFM